MSDRFTWDAPGTQKLVLGADQWTDITFGNDDGDLVTEWTWHDGLPMWVHLQWAVVQEGPRFDSKGNSLWPTWIDIQIMQYLKDRPGQTPDDDPTALETAVIVKRRQGGLYTVEMDTIPGERYRIHMQHNGKVRPKLDKGILKVGSHLTEVLAR